MSESIESRGAVHIAEDVVASVAALAATETEGVAALASGISGDISDFLGKKNNSKGVKLVMEGSSVTVDVFLFVRYGAKIQEVARRVQDAVASAIESMTGLTAAAVNVHVNGVSFEKDKK
ncbi:hypothetical protein FACS1894202_12910 [Clostridia bacterium]|nr:hypothetical protein FACS1894202_12910 [Clostridia bacterium]